MNNAKLLIAVIVAVTLMIVCPVAFGNNPAPAKNKNATFEEHFLDLSGIMSEGDEKLSDYTVHIFQDGSPSDTFQVTTKLEQHYMLPLNHNYALKFTKPGYKERILLVNTFVESKNLHHVYTFRYEIQFLENDEQNTFDDFPVAFVHYDTEKKDFDYNRTYHQNVRTDVKPQETTTASRSWH